MRAHSPAGSSMGHVRGTVDRRPCTLPAAALRLGQRLGHDPFTVRRPHGHEGILRSGVVGEATEAEADRRARQAARHSLRAWPAAPRRPGRGQRARHRAHRRPPARRPPRSSASRCTGRGGRAGPWPPRAASGRRAARAANLAGRRPRRPARPAAPRCQACRTRTGCRPWRRAPRSNAPASPGRGPRPSSPPAPPRGRAGVTHATRGAPSTSTVQQPHWPCGLQPSLTDRTPRRSRSTSSREVPSSGTSTRRPSTVRAMPASMSPTIGSPAVISRRTFLAAGAGLLVAGACGSERKGASGAGTMSSGPANTSGGSDGRDRARHLLPGRHSSRGPGAAAAVRPRQLRRRGDHRRPGPAHLPHHRRCRQGGPARGRGRPPRRRSAPPVLAAAAPDRYARHVCRRGHGRRLARHLDLLARRSRRRCPSPRPATRWCRSTRRRWPTPRVSRRSARARPPAPCTT